MRDQTNSSLMKKKQKDQQYWHHIHHLECTIIVAIMAIEAPDLFEMMEVHRSCMEFREHWSDFRDLAEQWLDRESLWNDLDKLKEQRDWNVEHEVVQRAFRAFISATPWKRPKEWTENDRAGASSKGATPETREPTFGGAFRKFILDLEHLINLIDQDNLDKASKINKGWERIRDQEIVIGEAIKKLPNDELFKTMVAGLKTTRVTFMDCWRRLEKLSSGWEESSSNDKNPATYIDDTDWKNDRLTLGIIDKNISWAFPWGSKQDDEWKNDYRAGLKAIPELPHLTFRQAWDRMTEDMLNLENHLSVSRMVTSGRSGDRKYWDEIQYLEVRIRDNVPKFPHHPIFEHMIIPGKLHSRDRERSDFMSAWQKLEKLSQKWKATSDIWNHKEDFITIRGWKKDAQVLDEIRVRFDNEERPRGFEDDLEWTKKFLPVPQMKKDMEFTVDERDLKYLEV